ncbi:flagellar biosynthesis anti-sigma factor FlgM [Aquabacterium sp.]|uniref:flagellar biosynthesis anti-sigma factor FlgM n=1 Tax=Aquabacterium sp. TaxID=1872578 RepID=UPI0019BA3288|nr:flagellar biosynthesis anti-sigma factor FlgM [Aquabacterium sp.]MBC7701943.1 flagellar biosynthesis anti-sigma factor FlgM [Aquabacterium sp.]
MKIGNPSDKPVGGASSAKTEATTNTKTTGKTASLDGGVSESAKVTLSNTASTLLSGADPTFDAHKVSQVKQSIDDGSYKVDPEAIADKLIANSRELLERQH